MQADMFSASNLLDGIDPALLDPEGQRKVLALAEQVARYMVERKEELTSPDETKRFFRALLNTSRCKEREFFFAAFLNSQHKLIACEELFAGTLDSCSVHPRVVVKRALELNACALVLAHNHPSGLAEASAADRKITDALRKALDLVEVRVLDHIVIGTGTDEATSFAERGWL
jgi:DNA repair protein RadC